MADVVSDAKRALVTGAAAGLGKAFAENLVSDGWKVVAVDRDADGLRLLLVELGEQVSTILGDLSSQEGMEQLLQLLTKGLTFDLVIHNAGISSTGHFEDIPLDAHMRLLQVNTHAPIKITNALLQAGSFNPNAHLLFVSSLSHAVGYPGAASYGASKDAIASYGASLAKKLKTQKIHVSTAFPGPLRTDHAARHAPAGASAEKRMSPEEAAEKILKSTFRKSRSIYPGIAARLTGFAGKLLPGPMAMIMRRVIYDKLDHTQAD